MRLLQGRRFDENDTAGSEPVVIVNEAYANSVTNQIMPRRTDNTSGDVAGDARGRALRALHVDVPVAADARGNGRLDDSADQHNQWQLGVVEADGLVQFFDWQRRVRIHAPIAFVTRALCSGDELARIGKFRH